MLACNGGDDGGAVTSLDVPKSLAFISRAAVAA
jgi:hypothetical protein